MLRALRALTVRPGPRRTVGLALLVAFALVVVLAASHAGEASDGHRDHCGVCSTAALVGASETFAPPALVDVLALCDRVAQPEREVLVVHQPRRLPSPRGPPTAA